MGNKNYFITGISRGLGLEITKLILNSGNHVYGLCRSTSTELEELIILFPDKLKWTSFDLMESEKIKSMVFKNFITKDIKIHGFVNNAALAYDDIITNLNINKLEEMFRANVFSPMIITKYIIRQMLLHNNSGSIVHVSSISAHTGYKGLAMYASTKGALEAFSKNTAREWGEKGVRSNCVVAGFMETDMSSSLNEEQKTRIYNRTSLKTPTSVQSVAETICFLLSEKACSITGQNILVDSGTI